jgi:hypothetical protein
MRIQSGLLSVLFKTLALSCLFLIVFSGCKSKAKQNKAFPDKPAPVWQKIKIATVNNQTYEITNPGIDYSDDASSVRDVESFGIRVQNKDETNTILWDDIRHIEFHIKQKKLIGANITLRDGTVEEVIVFPDSKGGLSGTCNSKECNVSLREVKAIEVLPAN